MLVAMLWRLPLLLAAYVGVVAGDGQQALGSHNTDLDHIREKLLEAQIIPTVIDDFPPALSLRVKWKHDSAALGNTLKPDHLKKAPVIHLDRVESEALAGAQLSKHMSYVIVLTDPDAPSRDDPKWSEFCHWIAASSQLKFSSKSKSKHHLKDIIKYKPPAPPPKTGKHRYVFFTFIAANGTTKKLHLSKPEERKHWGSDHAGHGVREWAHENGLIPIGKDDLIPISFTEVNISSCEFHIRGKRQAVAPGTSHVIS
ncbi:Carboxypeptidase Y inhibitor [Fusarium oxysporum f. sp. cubense race 1]|uniref:Carboxypeptidase Y inhibitor n=1 Tax=Fusarium oxysporum f. sp. cubense (strain race 1) TaxID=1229664 RepID=N4TQW3_FUSC1|nr:Carboxypeptidase Y inhibitor [Fusarium oxysporum f. sp. cubense race 1]